MAPPYLSILVLTNDINWSEHPFPPPPAGHFLDQKRLKQGLYRHPWDDISYVLPEINQWTMGRRGETFHRRKRFIAFWHCSLNWKEENGFWSNVRVRRKEANVCSSWLYRHRRGRCTIYKKLLNIYSRDWHAVKKRSVNGKKTSLLYYLACCETLMEYGSTYFNVRQHHNSLFEAT